MDGPPAVIRTDPAPGFKALVDDKFLQKHRITLELGCAKNPNKNPVAEKAILELEGELGPIGWCRNTTRPDNCNNGPKFTHSLPWSVIPRNVESTRPILQCLPDDVLITPNTSSVSRTTHTVSVLRPPGPVHTTMLLFR